MHRQGWFFPAKVCDAFSAAVLAYLILSDHLSGLLWCFFLSVNDINESSSCTIKCHGHGYVWVTIRNILTSNFRDWEGPLILFVLTFWVQQSKPTKPSVLLKTHLLLFVMTMTSLKPGAAFCAMKRFKMIFKSWQLWSFECDSNHPITMIINSCYTVGLNIQIPKLPTTE